MEVPIANCQSERLDMKQSTASINHYSLSDDTRQMYHLIKEKIYEIGGTWKHAEKKTDELMRERGKQLAYLQRSTKANTNVNDVHQVKSAESTYHRMAEELLSKLDRVIREVKNFEGVIGHLSAVFSITFENDVSLEQINVQDCEGEKKDAEKTASSLAHNHESDQAVLANLLQNIKSHMSFDSYSNGIAAEKDRESADPVPVSSNDVEEDSQLAPSEDQDSIYVSNNLSYVKKSEHTIKDKETKDKNVSPSKSKDNVPLGKMLIQRLKSAVGKKQTKKAEEYATQNDANEKTQKPDQSKVGGKLQETSDIKNVDAKLNVPVKKPNVEREQRKKKMRMRVKELKSIYIPGAKRNYSKKKSTASSDKKSNKTSKRLAQAENHPPITQTKTPNFKEAESPVKEGINSNIEQSQDTTSAENVDEIKQYDADVEKCYTDPNVLFTTPDNAKPRSHRRTASLDDSCLLKSLFPESINYNSRTHSSPGVIPSANDVDILVIQRANNQSDEQVQPSADSNDTQFSEEMGNMHRSDSTDELSDHSQSPDPERMPTYVGTPEPPKKLPPMPAQSVRVPTSTHQPRPITRKMRGKGFLEDQIARIEEQAKGLAPCQRGNFIQIKRKQLEEKMKVETIRKRYVRRSERREKPVAIAVYAVSGGKGARSEQHIINRKQLPHRDAAGKLLFNSKALTKRAVFQTIHHVPNDSTAARTLVFHVDDRVTSKIPVPVCLQRCKFPPRPNQTFLRRMDLLNKRD